MNRCRRNRIRIEIDAEHLRHQAVVRKNLLLHVIDVFACELNNIAAAEAELVTQNLHKPDFLHAVDHSCVIVRAVDILFRNAAEVLLTDLVYEVLIGRFAVDNVAVLDRELISELNGRVKQESFLASEVNPVAPNGLCPDFSVARLVEVLCGVRRRSLISRREIVLKIFVKVHGLEQALDAADRTHLERLAFVAPDESSSIGRVRHDDVGKNLYRKTDLGVCKIALGFLRRKLSRLFFGIFRRTIFVLQSFVRFLKSTGQLCFILSDVRYHVPVQHIETHLIDVRKNNAVC